MGRWGELPNSQGSWPHPHRFSPPPPEKANRFTEELADLQVEEKGTAMFTCKTEYPAAVVTWRKGLLELRASGKHMPSQEGVTLKLTISALEKVDSDTYTCDIGQAQSQARLLVQGEASTLHGFHSLWYGQCKPCLKQTWRLWTRPASVCLSLGGGCRRWSHL